MSRFEPRFYACDDCRILIETISGDSERFECCGIPMKELKPNTSDGAGEKHLPVAEREGNKVTVKVGSVFHPMSEEHSIEWIYLQTERGGQRVNLSPDQAPQAEFLLPEDDRPIAAYAYCNLHGFWKTNIC